MKDDVLSRLAGEEDSGLFYVHNGKLPTKVCCAYCSSSKYVAGGSQLYFTHDDDCPIEEARQALKETP